MPIEDTPERFKILTVLGSGRLFWNEGSMKIQRGDSLFVPACTSGLCIQGNLDVLLMMPGPGKCEDLTESEQEKAQNS